MFGLDNPFKAAGEGISHLEDPTKSGLGYNSQRNPYALQVGGNSFDFRDPRVAAGVALSLMGMPMIGAPLAAYGAGRQADNQRQDRRLERKYEPIADENASRAQQAAIASGMGGSGIGNQMGKNAFEQIMQMLAAEKQAVRRRQLEQEMQAMSAIGQMAMSYFGANPGAASTATTGA